MSRLIPNAELQVTDLPAFSVSSLDPEGFTQHQIAVGGSGREWKELWDFALTFDGYQYFGDDEEAAPRLDAFARSISDAFANAGELPAIDLALLRACLFYEQRAWCKQSMEVRCPPELAVYLGALLHAIRTNIT